MKVRLGLCFFLAIWAWIPSAPLRACDLALALAVDVSGSDDADEYSIQMTGLADAIRDGAVIDALVQAKAQVMMVQWTGDTRQQIAIGWTRMTDAATVKDFALAIEQSSRQCWQYSTAIGAALSFAANAFAGSECRRKVIDISGDGASNEGVEPLSLRTHLWRNNFTVNALVIEGSEPDLTAYYWENVIAGENAFVVSANGFEEYPEKIKLKLLREVTKQVSRLEPGNGAPWSHVR